MEESKSVDDAMPGWITNIRFLFIHRKISLRINGQREFRSNGTNGHASPSDSAEKAVLKLESLKWGMSFANGIRPLQRNDTGMATIL